MWPEIAGNREARRRGCQSRRRMAWGSKRARRRQIGAVGERRQGPARRRSSDSPEASASGSRHAIAEDRRHQVRHGLAERERANQQPQRQATWETEPARRHLHRRRINGGQCEAGEKAQSNRGPRARCARAPPRWRGRRRTAPAHTRCRLSTRSAMLMNAARSVPTTKPPCTAIVSHDASVALSCSSRERAGVTEVAENHSVIPRNSARAMTTSWRQAPVGRCPLRGIGSKGRADTLHEDDARQRARRHRPRGPPAADGGGEPLVPRRIEERAARAHGVRALVRAPDVRRLGAPRLRVLRAAATGRRAAQWLDQHRSHELLGGHADRRARPGAVDGVRSHGLPPARADRGEVRQPARRGAQRAPAELREPAVRPGGCGALRGAVPAGSPVPLDHHRRSGGSARRDAGRCPDLLRDLLSPGQRVVDAGGRHRDRRVRSSWRSSTSARFPRGRCLLRSRPPLPTIASRSLLLEDRVELPRLYLSWHSPAMFSPDDAELDLTADVLAHGKTSRLYRQLVYERRVATDVSAYQHSRELSGLFQIACTAAAGVALPVLEQAITDAVQLLAGRRPHGRRAGPGARPRPRRNSSIGCRRWAASAGKSDQLNAYNVFNQNPGFFDADLARYQSVTGAGMAAAVRRWLVGQPRVALSVVPRGERALALPDATRGPGLVSPVDRTKLPAPGPAAAVRVPDARRAPSRERTARACHLASVGAGHGDGAAAARGVVRRRVGAGRDWPRSPPICWTRAAAVSRRSKYPDRIARMGGDLDLEVSHDATVISLATLDRFLDQGLSLVHEICAVPNLAEPDFQRVRQLRLERLRQLRDHPAALADRAFAQLLYQSHPYAQPGYGTGRVAGGPDHCYDVRQYHAAMFQPDGATLVLAGSQPTGALLEKAAAAFDGWRGDPDVAADSAGSRTPGSAAQRPPRAWPSCPAPARRSRSSGSGTCPRRARTPDYHALVLLNTVLGGQFVSRLNMNLREDKGYTYGVRTGFDLRRGDGPFVLQTSVGTEVTVSALGEAFNELREIRDGRPVTADELALAKSSVTLGYPRGLRDRAADCPGGRPAGPARPARLLLRGVRAAHRGGDARRGRRGRTALPGPRSDDDRDCRRRGSRRRDARASSDSGRRRR